MTKILALALILMMAGCSASGTSGDTPESVAQAFWTAAKNKDQAGAEALATGSENSSFQFDSEETTITSFSLGEATKDGDVVLIPTHILADTDGPDMDMEFETALIQQDGKWLVEMDRTSGSLLTALLGVSMEALGDAMAEGMQEAMEGLGEAMMEGMESMAEGMADAMEETAEEMKSQH